MMVKINLISTGRLNARRQRARARRWLVAGSIYTLVLIVGCGAYRLIWQVNTPNGGATLQDLQAQTQSIQDAINETQARLEETSLSLKASRELSEHPDWSLLLRFLADMLGDDLVLRGCDIRMLTPGVTDDIQAAADRSSPAAQRAVDDAATRPLIRLSIQGMGRSLQAVSQFALRIEQTRLFTHVKLVDTNLEPYLKGKVITFHIECTLEPAAEGDG